MPTLFPSVRPAYDTFYPVPPFDSHYESLVPTLPLPFRRLAYKGRILSEVLDLLARVSTRHQQRHRQARPTRTQFRKYNDLREAVPCLFHNPCKSQPRDTDEAGATPDPAQLSRHIALALIIYCTHAFAEGGAAMYTGVMYTQARKTTDTKSSRRNAASKLVGPRVRLHARARNQRRCRREHSPPLDSSQPDRRVQNPQSQYVSDWYTVSGEAQVEIHRKHRGEPDTPGGQDDLLEQGI